MIILLLNAMELSLHYYNNWDLHYLIIIKKPYLHREYFLMKIENIICKGLYKNKKEFQFSNKFKNLEKIFSFFYQK